MPVSFALRRPSPIGGAAIMPIEALLPQGDPCVMPIREGTMRVALHYRCYSREHQSVQVCIFFRQVVQFGPRPWPARGRRLRQRFALMGFGALGTDDESVRGPALRRRWAAPGSPWPRHPVWKVPAGVEGVDQRTDSGRGRPTRRLRSRSFEDCLRSAGPSASGRISPRGEGKWP